MTDTVQQTDDERRLAELGYTQALQRSWSSFSNFAISFTIISVLAGCFTTYGQAWNNGGPIAICPIRLNQPVNQPHTGPPIFDAQ